MRKAGAVVVGLLAARTFFLYVQQIRGQAARYHVEAAAVMFVVAGLILLLASSRSRPVSEAGPRRSITLPALTTFAFFLAAAFALYWPTLSIGLLSDDFVLWEHAAAWNVGPVSSSLFRPLPLLVWSLLISAGATPVALHVLNIVLHGTNGYLVSRLGEGWGVTGAPAMLAGGLMIAVPLAGETVSWASCVFDLSATALMLSFVLLGRTYSDSPGAHPRRLAFICAGILAMTAKETAAIGGLLVIIDAWVRRGVTRRLVTDTGIVIGAAAAFAAVRMFNAWGVKAETLTKYRFQRVLFDTYGSFAVPWHVDLVHIWPYLAMAGALIVLAIVSYAFMAAGRTSSRALFGGAAWMFATVLPVFPFIFIGPDLQNTRFLYSAAPGWACLIAAIASSANNQLVRRLTLSAAVGLLVIWAAAARAHLAPWKSAAIARDQILEAAKSNRLMRACEAVAIAKLPDHIRGAYLFRNGAPEALSRAIQIRVSADARPECRFVWDEATGAFSRAAE